jgi:PII-like signaling protein
MKATVLRLYVHESRRRHGMLLYDWLLETARRAGIHGGSVFRAISGYGRHGVVHEQHHYELAGELPVVAEFIISDLEADQLLSALRKEQIDLVYARWEAHFSSTSTLADGTSPRG